MKLNSKIENFYKAILNYAGLDVEEDGSVVLNSGERKPIKGKDGKVLHLPYMELLKQPDGKMFFHVLNENFLRPESEAFNIFKDNLLLEINSKLTYIMTVLIDIAAQPDIQKSIKSRELLELLGRVGGADGKLNEIEVEMGTTLRDKVLLKAINENGSGGFVDFFIRKNGMIDKVDYRVVGKTNFFLYKELTKALEEKNYKLFGVTVRKKDILVYLDIINAIFPDIDNEVAYSAGSDNVVFGYLNALLAVSFIVTDRINSIIRIIADDLGGSGIITVDDCFNVEWAELLEGMYDLTREIRYIPNQDDVSTPTTKKLKVNENVVKQEPILQEPIQQQAPTFNPQMAQPQQQPQLQQQPQQQPQQHQPSLEELVGSMGSGFNAFQQPQPPYFQQPQLPMNGYGQMPMQQPPMPQWMQQQMMQRQQAQYPQMMQQPMAQQQPQMMQQPQYGQQAMYNQNPYGMTGGQPQYGYQQNPYNQQFNGYGQQTQYGYDAFSHIEPSGLNGG